MDMTVSKKKEDSDEYEDVIENPNIKFYGSFMEKEIKKYYR